MKLKKRDLVLYDTGVVATVLKTYTNLETKEEYVQAFTDTSIIYDKADSFKPVDCMTLRCNSCNKESYEIDLDVSENNGMYVCECGSSTFTPLNMDLEELNYN